MNVAVIGATGFIGSALLRTLASNVRHDVVGFSRDKNHALPTNVRHTIIGDIAVQADFVSKLQGIDVVLHAVARAQIMNDKAADPLAEFRHVNVLGTLNLARQAAEAGVGRFLFISSIKVNGEQTAPGQFFTADDSPAPEDPYGISKWEAEQGLLQIGRETGMEVVIIRPPLVYGPGVKGNFANMIKLLEKGLPLPLGAIHNKRSLVALDNLVGLINTCIDHPAAVDQVFLAGDGEDLSTSDLLRLVAVAMGKPSRLVPMPVGILQFGATLLGKQAMAKRLLGSLQVDISKTRELLDWTPPLSVHEGLKCCFKNIQKH